MNVTYGYFRAIVRVCVGFLGFGVIVQAAMLSNILHFPGPSAKGGIFTFLFTLAILLGVSYILLWNVLPRVKEALLEREENERQLREELEKERLDVERQLQELRTKMGLGQDGKCAFCLFPVSSEEIEKHEPAGATTLDLFAILFDITYPITEEEAGETENNAQKGRTIADVILDRTVPTIPPVKDGDESKPKDEDGEDGSGKDGA